MAATGQPTKPCVTKHYVRPDGSCPFEVWFDGLPLKGQALVAARLVRVRLGNKGQTNSVGQGVQELKFRPKGHPTYRVYFAEDGPDIILLLCGGDKTKQNRDIEEAKGYWHDYQKRQRR